MRVCAACKKSKKNVDFKGENKTCKNCLEKMKQYSKQYYYKNYEKVKQYRQKNSEIIKQRNKQYRQENPEKVKQYRQENSEKAKQYQKQYRQENSEKAKQYRQENSEKLKQYYKQRRRQNQEYRLKSNLRARLRSFIKQKTKTVSHIRDLGCSIDFLREHIEMQFYPHPVTGEMMAWDSHGKGNGKWQVDHIKEFQEIDINDHEQLLSVVHFSNLQPLWTIDHQKKTLDTNSKL